MAEKETTQNGGDKVAAMSSDPQIIHLTGRVDRLETDVHDIKAGVQKLLDRPQNPGFSQVIGTLLATLGACAIIFGFAKWHLYEAFNPLREDVVILKQKYDEAERQAVENRVKNAILEERANWLKSQRGWTPK